MITSAGRLDQRITIQQKTVARGALGGHAETWADLATIWAETRDMTGREIFNAKAIGNAATMLLTIRFRADIKADMRVLFSDGLMGRIEWIRHVTRREYMELYCVVING